MPVEVRIDTIPIEPEIAVRLQKTQHYSRIGFDESQGAEVPEAMEVVVLENERVRIQLAPMLAGRIVGWRDKSKAIEFDPSKLLSFSPDPMVELQAAAYRMIEADGPDAAAGVLLFGLADSLELSWQAAFSLMPDSAWVDIEFQTTNRTTAWEGNPGIKVEALAESRTFGGDYLHVVDSNANGLLVQFERGAFVWNDQSDSEPALTRLPGTVDRLFTPRQTDRWSGSIVATTELRSSTCFSRGFACSIESGRLGIQSFGPSGEFKLVLELSSGQRVETKAQIYPEKVEWVDLSSLDGTIAAFAILDSAGKKLWANETSRPSSKLVWVDEAPGATRSERGSPGQSALASAGLAIELGLDPREHFARAEAYVETKGAALELRGDHALVENRFTDAIEAYDLALAYSAEDALLWWRKAYAMRLAGDDQAGEALANAHFLSPLEFLLRVEAFLSQSHLETTGSPLVAPLAMFPCQMRAAACQLLDLGQILDVARWIDECLRHVEIPELRLLLASLHLQRGARVEAYAQIEKTFQSKLEIRPVLRCELRAVRRLRQEFPEFGPLAEIGIEWS